MTAKLKMFYFEMTLIAIAVLPVKTFAGNFQGAVPTKDQYHAIFQIDSDSETGMKKTLTNIKNLLEDSRLKGKIQVELIANSKGYAIYKKGNGFEDQLKNLESQGVILAECQNTLREMKVSPDTLYPFIKLVPSGVGELVIRQSEGWGYIHPSP